MQILKYVKGLAGMVFILPASCWGSYGDLIDIRNSRPTKITLEIFFTHQGQELRKEKPETFSERNFMSYYNVRENKPGAITYRQLEDKLRIEVASGATVAVAFGWPPQEYARFFSRVDLISDRGIKSYTFPEIISQAECETRGGTSCKWTIE